MTPEKLAVHHPALRQALADRVAALGLTPGTAVCVGARSGAEVEALLDLGWFAVGIDIQPLDASTVLRGDMHTLRMPDHAVDLVYTNIVYEAQDLARFLAEVRRVLKRSGHFLMEIARFVRDAPIPKWQQRVGVSSLDALMIAIGAQGWAVREMGLFEQPFRGHSVLWRVA